MKLVIVSHTEHYLIDGVNEAYSGWGATVREIDQLATLFDEVVHVAPLHISKGVNKNPLQYRAANVRVQPVAPSGGASLLSKFGILFRFPIYAKTMIRELQSADTLHVRCPANISLAALLLMILLPKRQKRWIKYGGNWSPANSEPLSYSLQRWLIRSRLHRGFVTVNGEWPGQPQHVRSFVNPCLTNDEIKQGYISSKAKKLSEPYRILYVGRVETPKGADRVIRTLALVRGKGIEATLEIVGDGAECETFKLLARDLGLSDIVRFHGWLARDAVNAFYAVSHFIVLPSYSSEGWPKVLSEAMAYGVLPVAGNVSSIPYYLNVFRCGRAVRPTDIDAIADAIMYYINNTQQWAEEMKRAVDAATQFTYKSYLESVRDLLNIPAPIGREEVSE